MGWLSQMENKKFSDNISDLVEMWWEWMKHDGIARNKSFDIKTRKDSAEKCEILIKKEYNIIENLNVNYITPTPRLAPAPAPGTLDRMLRVAQSIGVIL